MISKLRALSNKYFRTWDGPLTSAIALDHPPVALGKVPTRLVPDATTETVCGYCSTGCSLKVHLKNREAINLSADYSYPVNKGMACPKGWLALDVLNAPDRATEPLLRSRNGFSPVSWEEALKKFCFEFSTIQQKYGASSVAFLSTGQIVTEEMAFLGALAKFGMGMVHGDGNTRQCMATAATAYKESFGFDAPPYTYQDFEESDVLVFVGANPCIAHPIMWKRVLENKRNPAIIVVDPRKTETAVAAGLHVPLRPKSDLSLFYGLANWMFEHGFTDTEFTGKHVAGTDDYRSFVSGFTLNRVLETTELPEDTFLKLAHQIASGKRVSFWWTMGVNQSYEGTRLAQALINLALITGNIGKPGTGANSITGQCNAMGSRLFSNTTNLLGGHDFQNAEHREKVAEAIGIPVDRIPDQPSKSYHEILDAVETGEIKGLWILATNTSHSWINSDKFRKLRDKLEFLVVQDMYYSTETAQLADLILPAAGWGEKEGTFINSERRIGRVRKVRRSPGMALSDFNIFKLIAHYWGCSELFSAWESPEAVFGIIKKLSKDQPCDISGIRDYRMLEESGGIQWPYPAAEHDNRQERRLFENGVFYHSDGKARLCFEQPKNVPEERSGQFPFILLTGRGSSSQWHTQTRTGKSEILRKLYPQEIYVEVSPKDARQIGISTEDKVFVISRRATIEAKVVVTQTVLPGQVFIPMHYAATNRLTMESFDPYSKQPSYKYATVRIEPCNGRS